MKRMKQFTSRMLAVMLAGTLAVGSLSVTTFGAESAESTVAAAEEFSFYEATENSMTEATTSEVADEEVMTESSSAETVDEEVMSETSGVEEASDESVTELPDGTFVDTTQIPAEEAAVTSYTITLDANGGYFINEWDDSIGDYVEQAEVVVKQIPVGGTVNVVPVNEQEDVIATFLGWSLERDGEIVWEKKEAVEQSLEEISEMQELEGYLPVDNCILYAGWSYEDSDGKAVEFDDKTDVAEGPDWQLEEATSEKANVSNGETELSNEFETEIPAEDTLEEAAAKEASAEREFEIDDSEDASGSTAFSLNESTIDITCDDMAFESNNTTDDSSEAVTNNAVDNDGSSTESISAISQKGIAAAKKENGVFVGTLGENNELDGYLYEWADGCYTPYVANELSNCVLNKDFKVVYKLENGKITKFARLSSILVPAIKISATPDTFIYENGTYKNEKISLNIQLYLKLDKDCPFNRYELSGVQGLSITVSQINYSVDSDILNFGKSGLLFKRTITEQYDKKVEVSYGHDICIEHDVYVDNEVVPDKVNTIVNISGTIYNNMGEQIEVGGASITVGNIDLQKSIAEEKKNASANYSALQNARSQLNSCSAVVVDPNLSSVFSTSQINQIEDFLVIYFSQIIYAADYKNESFLSNLASEIKNRIEDRILDKLGVTKHLNIFAKSTSFRVQVKGTSKSGDDVTVEFSGTIDNYISGDDNPFGSFVQFNHKIKNMEAVPSGTPETGTGVATFYNMESFANIFLSYIKTGYSSAWGKSADQIASMIISKPINELLLNGSFSDSVYDFSVQNVKNSVKKYSIYCPVDVYVYDDKGALSGSIVDNKISSISDDVVLSVCDDQKYVYAAKGTYALELIGSDNGNLQYTVEEISDNHIYRNAKIKDVPLSDGVCYTSVITDIPFADCDIISLYNSGDETAYTASVDSNKQNNSFSNQYLVDAGSCGEDARYAQYSDGTLNIIGTGAVNNEGVYTNDKYRIVDLHVFNGITSIGSYLFADTGILHWTTKPVSVSLADSVTEIGTAAFRNCKDLETVTIGSGLETLGECAFSCCPSLKQISVSPYNACFESEEGILFSKNKSVIYKMPNQNRESYAIPEEVKTVGVDAFGDLTGLKDVDIPSSVKKISDYAFDGCSALNNVILPAGLEEIGYQAFHSCKSFTSISIPEGVSYIGSYAFEDCNNLETIIIPKSVTEIGTYAFNGCNKIVIYGYSGSYAENYAKEASIPFEVIGKTSIRNSSITGLFAKAYTGKAITQIPIVTLGSTTLTHNIDYTVSYFNNTNAGTATVMITGKGNYTGTKTATFKINKAAQSITAKAAASRIAVGKTTTVSITGAKGIKSFKSSNTAIANVDAKTGKITPKKVGTAKITATSAATANYNAASKTVTIKVVPAATASLKADNQATGIKLTWKKVTGANGYKVYRGSTLIKTITSGNTVTFADTKANTNGTKYTYKVVAKAATGDSTLSKSVALYRVARPAISSVTNSAASKMTVKWGKNAKATGYQIQYSTDKTFKTGNKAVTVAGASAVSKVIGSLTKSKTYYVRIRTYKTVGSAKYWSVWSTAKGVKIKPVVIVKKGNCGKSIRWKLDSYGKLTIAETGMIPDYYLNTPWPSKAIKTIVIEEGVIGIGKNVFYDCDTLLSVVIPASITKIGEDAFAWCNKLSSVKISKKLINDYAEAFKHTPWFNSKVNKELALKIYNRELKGRKGDFSLLYITNDNIPDLIFRNTPYDYILFVNGEFMESVCVGGPGTTLHFAYYPYKNFYKICEDNKYPSYYTVASKNRMIVCYKCLSAVSYGYYESFISDNDYGNYFNSDLNKWIADREITRKEFNSIKAKRADGVSEKQCKFIKYSNGNIR